MLARTLLLIFVSAMAALVIASTYKAKRITVDVVNKPNPIVAPLPVPVPMIIPIPTPSQPAASVPNVPVQEHSAIHRAQKRHNVTVREHSTNVIVRQHSAKHKTISCTQIRSWVATFGAEMVLAEAHRRGISESNIQAAKSCLK